MNGQSYLMMMSSNGNIFRVTGPFWGNPPVIARFFSSPVAGGFPSHRPVTRNFDVFFDLSLNHTMDLLWEKFQWILPLYMKPISFQSKASDVCSVTAAIFIVFCLNKLNVFPNILKKNQMNIWIPQNKSPGIEMLITDAGWRIYASVNYHWFR